MIKKIFLIDNEKKILQLIQNFLLDGNSSKKFEIHTYEDGNEAIRDFVKNKPDLMILDYDMPAITGVDMLKKLYKKNSDAVKNTNIVVTTSNYDALKLFKDMNVSYFLPKPFNKDDLWNIIHILAI